MIIIVCGGREYNNVDAIYDALNRVHAKKRIECIVHGDCTGADKIAECWAINNGVNYAKVPAMWEHHGKAAGPRRNALMLRLASGGLVAFPGGRGTASMIRLARDAGIPVWEPCQ